MEMVLYTKVIKWLYALFFLVIFDISIKYWIKTCFVINEVVCIIPGINFCYLKNFGLAFGFFSDMTVLYRWICICLTIIIIIMFFISLLKSIYYCIVYENIAYVMIIGGAVGNLYDRVLHGSVIDFIDLYIGSWHWPVFNIADVEIFIGMLILIVWNWNTFFLKKNKKINSYENR